MDLALELTFSTPVVRPWCRVRATGGSELTGGRLPLRARVTVAALGKPADPVARIR